VVLPAGDFEPRAQSEQLDSRVKRNVRGQPMFVYYAYNADDSDRVMPFITDIRWSRIGHWIH
jgi:hypothetical protein